MPEESLLPTALLSAYFLFHIIVVPAFEAPAHILASISYSKQRNRCAKTRDLIRDTTLLSANAVIVIQHARETSTAAGGVVLKTA
jgi:hypothetical protein